MSPKVYLLKIFLILVGYYIIPNYKTFFTLNSTFTKVVKNVVSNNTSNVSGLDMNHRYVDDKL